MADSDEVIVESEAIVRWAEAHPATIGAVSS
jgi:hypothetical protein